MQSPKPLARGSRVGIVTPSRKVDKEALLKGCSLIKSWGLQVELGEYAVGHQDRYLAASDDNRLADLQGMLDRDDIEAIFCSRGGYGMTRILDRLDFKQLKGKPKWIIGFSDITALHLRLESKGIESIHGCMPVQYGKREYENSAESVRKILFGEAEEKIVSIYNSQNRNGEASGTVIGGNLSMVLDSIGSANSPDTKGKILILEEIDEPLYKIDRMLTQLKRTKLLDPLAALIIGHMTDVKDTELPFGESITDLVLDKLSNSDFPVAFDFPIGHEAPNIAWRHGGKATLRVNEKGSILTFPS